MNKYKLINKTTGEEHICEKMVIDGWDYYVSDEPIKALFLRKFVFPMLIATNNPKIDISKVVDEVERLGREFLKEKGLKENSIAFTPFINGYNKSQETHPFSEEDMIEFAEWLTLNTNSTSIHGEYIYKNVRRVTKELIQIWKEQRPKILYYE